MDESIMKSNKFVAFTLMLFVLLISISAISAADLNDTDNTAENVLKEDNVKSSTFLDLWADVGISESKLDLDTDYKFNKTTDVNYDKGININKYSFEINGNNHVIDCDNQAKAFNFSGKGTFTIKNLIIKNGLCDSGSAIVSYSNLILDNVTFINCNSNGTIDDIKVGAVFVKGYKADIKNCNFIDNFGEEGASITSYGSDLNINKCTFISSSNKTIKGQIYIYNAIAKISNSNFLNTTSKYSTAIFAEEYSNVTISKSKFKNLLANRTAGAICFKKSNKLTISDCEFDNISSTNNGGAIFIDIPADENDIKNALVTIKNTKFNNCYSGFGGAILQLGGKLRITDTNFTYNIAEYDGGAIYTSYATVGISTSIFRSNSVLDNISYGGACYFDMGTVTIKNSDFRDNLGSTVSTLYAYDTTLSLQNNAFNNPSNVTSIYTVYGKIKSNTKNSYFNDIRSFNNKNNFYNFRNTAEPFKIVDNPTGEIGAEKYDLRDYGWVTPVKNQGFMGSCWEFGNFAALESALLRYTNKTYSLSINNGVNIGLQYSEYGKKGTTEGASEFVGWSYLVNWLGIFPDKYEEYDELSKISPVSTTSDDLHIQNVVIIPDSKKPGDREKAIKTALVKYGAVAVNHYADFNESKYYNPVTNAQFYNGKKSTDHRVCIVGWDDNYSKHNFLITPPGDGAWIVKNSWGSEWGDGGYFYLSYYDTSMGKDATSIAYVITNESYDRIYQHDIGGENYYHKEVSGYFNEFVAAEDTLIAAVGTQFLKAGMAYEVIIIVNGIEMHTQKGNSKYGGYETIQLNSLIQVKKGDKFVVGFSNKMFAVSKTRIPVESGKSYASTNNGKTWQDLKSVNQIAIVKAYTIDDIKVTKNLVKYYKNTKPFTAKVSPGEKVTFIFNKKKYTRTAGPDGLAKLNINAKPGGYKITTIFNNTKIVSYVKIKNTVISKNVARGYKSNYNYKVKLVDSAGKALAKTKAKVSINGKSKTYTTDKNGYITLKFKKLTKTQTVSVKNPKTKEVKKSKIKVVSRFSGAKNIVMYYFDGHKFKAKIIGNDGKAVGKNQVVKVKFNKKSYKLKTNAKGYITLTIPDKATPGKYKLTATYKGQTIKRTVKVKQNLKTKKFTVKKSAKKLTVKATVKNGKTAIDRIWVMLKLNGKSYAIKTNKHGNAIFTFNKKFISKLKVGKTYPIKFSVNRNTIKTTLKVKA